MISKTFFISEKQLQCYFPWAFFFIIGDQLLTQIKAFILKSAFAYSSDVDNLKLFQHLSLKQNLLSSVGSKTVNIKSIDTKESSGARSIFLHCFSPSLLNTCAHVFVVFVG